MWLGKIKIMFVECLGKVLRGLIYVAFEIWI